MSATFRDEDLRRYESFDGCPHENFDNDGADACNVDGGVLDGEDDIPCPPNPIETELDHGSCSNHGREEENADHESEQQRADILCQQFDSSDEAYTFYNEYAKYIGFSVRKDIRWVLKDGVEVKRRFVCSCRGHRDEKHNARENRKRKPRALTRTGCPALFEVIYDKGLSHWVVTDFVSIHNHPLAPHPSSMFFWSHRRVNEEDAALAMSLKGSGVRTTQIMNHFVQRASDFSSVGFKKTDLYNYINKEMRHRCIDGDVDTLVSIMMNLVKEDSAFYYTFEQNDSGQLTRLFWSDSASRHDYSIFGDLVLFDSTYRSNQYKMPIVVFVGVNNHRQSMVFAIALMTDELIESYTWALNAFLEAMGGKQPKSVITEGNPAIRAALDSTLPSVVHRLCSWHVFQNCLNKVNISGFPQDFCRVMFMKCSVDEFEEKWEGLLQKYKMYNNSWVIEIYKKKVRWAEAYLQGGFFAGCRSNQRCESLNSVIRRLVRPGMKMIELFDKLKLAVANIRHREHEAEVITLTSKPLIMTHLTEYASQAESVYTRASFDVFKKQLEQEALYIVDEKFDNGDGQFIYTLSRHQYRDRKSTLQYNVGEQNAKCSCMLFESFSFPCRHMIAVFKHENLKQLPLSCILKWWTRDVNSAISNVRCVSVYEKAESGVRFSELMVMCRDVFSWASQTATDFERVKRVIRSIPKRRDVPSTFEFDPQVPLNEALHHAPGLIKITLKLQQRVVR